MSESRIWILGSADPEMAAIESLLRECVERVEHAIERYACPECGGRTGVDDPCQYCGGSPLERRVSPAGAYRGARANIPLDVDTVYLVECAPDFDRALDDQDGLDQVVRIRRIDHHRPGDVGFGRPPADFLPASSIGQVISELARLGVYPTDGYSTEAEPGVAPGTFVRGGVDGWSVVVATSSGPATQQFLGDRVTAAACDHCLGAAWQGQCPGVSPAEVRLYRARMAESRPVDPIDPAEYQRRFNAAHQIIVDEICGPCREYLAPWFESTGYLEADWDPSAVIDTRPYGHLDELPDVACYLGVAYLAEVEDRDGRRKVLLGGATRPQQVRDFIERWAPIHGLTGIYGDPERGFAGGYVP